MATYTQEPVQFGRALSQRRSTTSNWHHTDALGSIRALTNSSQVTSDSYLYDAWGNPLSSTGTTVNPFRWVGNVGYYFDSATGLYYIRARTYQPTIARWTSVDPLFYMLAKAGMLGFGVVDPSLLPSLVDIYTYARNNSLSYVDPSGLFSDHHAMWYHHWFPKNQIDRLAGLCAPHGIIIDNHWCDQFTTPFTPGGMVNGMTHGWIHNGFHYKELFDFVVGTALNCCDALIGIQFLIVRAIEAAIDFNNGPGHLEPDPTPYWPWPPLVPYQSKPPGPDTDEILLAETQRACRGCDPEVPTRTPPKLIKNIRRFSRTQKLFNPSPHPIPSIGPGKPPVAFNPPEPEYPWWIWLVFMGAPPEPLNKKGSKNTTKGTRRSTRPPRQLTPMR